MSLSPASHSAFRIGRSPATVREIARVAGVSASSVSRALNDPERVSETTRERIRSAMDLLERGGPHPVMPTLDAIGCLFVDHTSGLRFSGFDATIWAGIARVAVDNGTEVQLLNMNRRGPKETIAEMCRSRGIGALAVRVDGRSLGVLDEVAESGVPSIVISHRHEDERLGYVCVRSRETSKDAVGYLISLGHRRIAFCTNLVPDQDHADRFDGYVDALAAHGIERRESYEITIPADADGGISAISRLRSLPEPPTAVYFADPVPTFGALRCLREMGIGVPEQMSVVGFDDDDLRTLSSQVFTSVCQDTPWMARVAGQALIRLMSERDATPPRLELRSHLEINATTGAAPA